MMVVVVDVYAGGAVRSGMVHFDSGRLQVLHMHAT